jgi:hypothetical protein
MTTQYKQDPEYYKKYYNLNKLRISAVKKSYRLKNKEKISQRGKRYWLLNGKTIIKNKKILNCIDCDIPINPYYKRCRSCAAKYKIGIKLGPLSNEVKHKMSISKLGELNPIWKGDNVGYEGVHGWIRQRKIKPKLCQKCNEKTPYDLANISGKYKRDINDFEWLCRRCHMLSDNRLTNLIKMNKQRHGI